MIADSVVIGWAADGTPVERQRLTPRLERLRVKLWACIAVAAAVDGDADTKQRVAAEMHLDEHAAQFVWDVLDAAVRADGFLRSGFTGQRLDKMTRDTALALIDATDEIVRTAQPGEEP
jgi:hypothetical protein